MITDHVGDYISGHVHLVIMLVIRFVKVIILVNLLNVDDHNDHGVYGHICISMAGSAGELNDSH